MKSENLTVRVPLGWKAQLEEIGQKLERDKSYLTRKALKQAHPELKEVKK